LAAAGKKVPAPQVVMIGIGAKNPTFDETKFPDLQFAYTPGITVVKGGGETAKAVWNTLTSGMIRDSIFGEPKFLVQWWDKQDLRAHGLFFDAKGVVAWEGEVEGDDVLDSDGEGVESSLGDALKTVLAKGKNAPFDEKKKIDFEKNDPDEALVAMKIPDFSVTMASGEVRNIKSVTESGKPVLVVFFQITSTSDLTNIQERMDKADKEKNEAEAWKCAAEKDALENLNELLAGIEKELFGRK